MENMRIPQLTLYDFLADFLPGAIALVLFGTLYWLIVDPSLTIPVNTGIALVVASYPVGRTFHAVAGQAEMKALRKSTFDAFAFALEEARCMNDPTYPDTAVTDEPSVIDQLKPRQQPETGADETRFNDWIDGELRAMLTGWDSEASSERCPALRASDDAAFSATEIDWTESFGQLQRFGYSELFDESTLYQRYNILETFYRNLWLVSAYFGLVFLVVGSTIATHTFGSNGLAEPILSVTVWVGWIAALGVVVFAIADFPLTESDPDSADGGLLSVPTWYWLGILVGTGIAIVLPVVVLFSAAPPDKIPHSNVFLAVALILLSLAVLFDIRRLQFKRRQVRAFINDLYLVHQNDADKN